jgi:hypothetical protein
MNKNSLYDIYIRNKYKYLQIGGSRCNINIVENKEQIITYDTYYCGRINEHMVVPSKYNKHNCKTLQQVEVDTKINVCGLRILIISGKNVEQNKVLTLFDYIYSIIPDKNVFCYVDFVGDGHELSQLTSEYIRINKYFPVDDNNYYNIFKIIDYFSYNYIMFNWGVTAELKTIELNKIKCYISLLEPTKGRFIIHNTQFTTTPTITTLSAEQDVKQDTKLDDKHDKELILYSSRYTGDATRNKNINILNAIIMFEDTLPSALSMPYNDYVIHILVIMGHAKICENIIMRIETLELYDRDDKKHENFNKVFLIDRIGANCEPQLKIKNLHNFVCVNTYRTLDEIPKKRIYHYIFFEPGQMVTYSNTFTTGDIKKYTDLMYIQKDDEQKGIFYIIKSEIKYVIQHVDFSNEDKNDPNKLLLVCSEKQDGQPDFSTRDLVYDMLYTKISSTKHISIVDHVNFMEISAQI